MQVHVLFWGRLKDIVGRAEDVAEVAEGCRVEDLFARYGREYPELADFRGSVAAAVNQVLADWHAPLGSGDEVAFLPPVSGGEAAGVKQLAGLVALVREPIGVAEIVARLKAPPDGAVVAFEGIVRDHSAGRRTLYLEYEGYEQMALAKLRELEQMMRQQFPVDGVALVHRLGRLEIGETSVLVGVSSAHRAAAFEACRFGIDTLKRTVPIWKKEYFEDGAVWAQGEVSAVGGEPPGSAALPSNLPPKESIG
jgi:molybdopterin synthase catalytic subunit/molybdopterin converting factor small subunit